MLRDVIHSPRFLELICILYYSGVSISLGTSPLTESASGKLDAAVAATDDMDTVTATKVAAGDLKLSDYLTGLDADGKITSGCTYAFTQSGRVTQTIS